MRERGKYGILWGKGESAGYHERKEKYGIWIKERGNYRILWEKGEVWDIMRERGKYRILWEKGESKRYEYKKGESIGYYERNCSWFNLTRD